MGFVWGAKDELPGRGPRLRRQAPGRLASCIAPRLAACTLVGRTRAVRTPRRGRRRARSASGVDRPADRPALRDTTGLRRRRSTGRSPRSTAASSSRTLTSSSRSAAGVRSRTTCSRGIGRCRSAAGGGRRPARARRAPARAAGELTAADVGGALGWRRKQAAAGPRRDRRGHATRAASASGRGARLAP